jgi:hypothetical protein
VIKLKKYLKKILAGSTVLIAILMFLGTSVVSAETSNTIQSPNISTNQGLSGSARNGANSASKSANEIGNNIGNQADEAASNIVRANRESSEKNAQSAIQSVDNIAGNVRDSASKAAGDGVSYTNLPSVEGFKGRVNNIIDEGGTAVLGWLIRIVYYATFWGMIGCFIMAIIGIFAKKISTWRFLGFGVLSLLIFYFMAGVLGISVSFTNNPIADLFNYALHG